MSTALNAVGGIGSINGQAATNQTLSVLVNGLETLTSSAGGVHVADINVAAIVGGSYVHTQAVAATAWTVTHNLGYRPSIQTFTTGGVVMEGDVLHLSVNTATITFVIPVAGSARCN